ncbi:MAG: arylsulfotransferase family protein, partial [Gaiellaceae bacterium]
VEAGRSGRGTVGLGVLRLGDRVTRRGFVGAAGAALAGLAAAPTFGARPRRVSETTAPGVSSFLSDPTLAPPAVVLAAPAGGTAPGYVFLAPFPLSAAGGSSAPPSGAQFGPLIVDDAGEPVWFLPVDGRTAMNLRVQRYRGRPVLTWYEGYVSTFGSGYGGDYVIADASYHEVTRVKAGHRLQGDLHEFLITSRGTALIAIFDQVPGDASAIGGPVDGQIVEGVVQEIDIAKKRVLFEWRSLEHVPVSETYRGDLARSPNVDYFHLNSIGVDLDGNLLVSGRHTSTVYKVDRRTGRVIWRLGGRKSDFAMGPGATFNFQHDARRHADGTITVFDNGAWGPKGIVEPSSRGLRLALDMKAMSAAVVAEYRTPDPRLTVAMGDVQDLPDGSVFVGWGTAGSFSEIGPEGDLRLDARFGDGSITYRAFRYPWVAHPTTLPSVVVVADPGGAPPTVHVSWNGATEVTRWQLRTGPTSDRLRPVRTVARTGFETAIALPAPAAQLDVVALDGAGRRLAATKVVRLA